MKTTNSVWFNLNEAHSVEKSDSQRQRVEWWGGGLQGLGERESVFKGYKVLVWEDEIVLVIDCGCTTTWMYLLPVNCMLKNGSDEGFPGGTVVKNPPANAGDTGSSPGPGRSHMPRSNWARAPQLLSLRSRAHEPQLLSPCAQLLKTALHNKRSHRNEKPAHHNKE